MNLMKRNLSSTSFFDDQTKRLRRNTCLEDLSNELFNEIFDYLDGYDIYNAFSNLNIRFDFFVKHSSIPLRIKLSSKSKSTLESRCRNVIIPNKHRILSLHLNSQSIIRSFLDYCIIDSSFDRLESVVLNGLSAEKLITILFYLNSLPRLFALTIEIKEGDDCYLNDIYRLIFHLPYLKYNKLSMSNDEESEIFLPKAINEKPSTIEHLIINHSCTLNELISILIHTPHLRHLTCKELCEIDEINNEHLQMQLKLSELIDISIGECELEFDKFEMFIKKISTKLQKLRLQTSSSGDYANGNRWKQLIKRHMPYFRQLYLDNHLFASYIENLTSVIETVRQFTSTFSTERYCYIEFRDNFDETSYSIHPYKKMWFDRHTDRLDRVSNQYTVKSNSIFSEQQSEKAFIPSIQLIIDGFSGTKWDQSCIDSMMPCFAAIPFNHLYVDCDFVSISSLIEIIRLLPNLDVLTVLSLPLVQLNDLPIQVTEMLSLVSNNNKITKVKLNTMDEIEQLQFLIKLCPRTQYLEVGCLTDYNLENIIGYISMNNVIHIPDLYSVCLFSIPVNETMMKKLDDIINNFERLFVRDGKNFCNYAMQRVQNKIYLDWKI